jgi:hypothetical protein
MKVLHGVNLEASFEKLKVSLNDARKSVKRNNTYSYAYAFGYLETAVVKHLRECTDDDGWNNDIPGELFQSPK